MLCHFLEHTKCIFRSRTAVLIRVKNPVVFFWNCRISSSLIGRPPSWWTRMGINALSTVNSVPKMMFTADSYKYREMSSNSDWIRLYWIFDDVTSMGMFSSFLCASWYFRSISAASFVLDEVVDSSLVPTQDGAWMQSIWIEVLP